MSEENSPKKNGMTWQAKTVMWTVIIGTCALLVSPPEVKLTALSLACAVPAVWGLWQLGKAAKQTKEQNAVLFAENPQEAPAFKKAARLAKKTAEKREKRIKKREEETQKKIISIAEKGPVLLRDESVPHHKPGPMVYNRITGSFQSLDRYIEWMKQYEKK
ncbi:hypothetical protein HZA76_04985 [Candidatus Roizmanbacteria bacterium]|nr:hypothetical protein [Candidatus Roizmanbacteria bacterium]